ncbi:MAG: hypothetical protein AMXMBFR81_01720 [Chthonomonas sp.]
MTGGCMFLVCKTHVYLCKRSRLSSKEHGLPDKGVRRVRMVVAPAQTVAPLIEGFLRLAVGAWWSASPSRLRPRSRERLMRNGLRGPNLTVTRVGGWLHSVRGARKRELVVER